MTPSSQTKTKRTELHKSLFSCSELVFSCHDIFVTRSHKLHKTWKAMKVIYPEDLLQQALTLILTGGGWCDKSSCKKCMQYAVSPRKHIIVQSLDCTDCGTSCFSDCVFSIKSEICLTKILSDGAETAMKNTEWMSLQLLDFYLFTRQRSFTCPRWKTQMESSFCKEFVHMQPK